MHNTNTRTKAQINNLIGRNQLNNIKNVKSKSPLLNLGQYKRTYWCVENLFELMQGHRQIKFAWQEFGVNAETVSSNLALLQNSTFVHPNAYNMANGLAATNYYVIKINKITIHLYFTHSLDKDKLDREIKKLILALKKFFMMNSYLLSKDKTLYISFFDLSLKLSLSGDLTPNNLNSGYTFVYDNDKINRIVIYRKDKRLKVLLHELCHAFDLQLFSQQFIDELELFINQNFSVLTVNNQIDRILIKETIAEFLGVYFKVLIENNARSPSVIHKELNNEFKSYIKMSNTILKTHKVGSLMELYKRSPQYNPSIYLTQKTNAFSYYILTALFLKNYQYILYNEKHDMGVLIKLMFGI